MGVNHSPCHPRGARGRDRGSTGTAILRSPRLLLPSLPARVSPPYNPCPVPLPTLRTLALVLVAGIAFAQPAPPAPSSFDDLARRADAARAAERLDEADSLYRQALALRPKWAEGLFYVGTMAYDRDRFEPCRDAFRRLSVLEPKMAPAWGFLGLCEFRLAAYAKAREHLEHALSLGMPPEGDLTRTILYHHALLLVRESKFEPALVPLRALLSSRAPTPEVRDVCGLVLLRRPNLPAEVPAADRTLLREAGQAYCAQLDRHTDAAVRLFAALVEKRPRERHLHYGYGLALAQAGSAESLDQFRREIELFPDDVLARVELAFGLLARGREQEAIAPGEAAARLAPGLFATHLVLGRALVATGKLPRGIREIETAAAMAPHIPEVHIALARAYAKAGRKADADRANAVFLALEGARRKGTPAKP
jgi:predicted Zn-dependent protease